LSGLREKYLRVVDLNGCGWIPCRVGVSQSTWSKYREKLEDVLAAHPMLLPSFRKGMVNFDAFGTRRRGNTIVDPWDCTWRFIYDGLQGQVIKHPIEQWSSLRTYSPPDPSAGIALEGEPEVVEWKAVRESVETLREASGVVSVSMPHGFFFQRLYYLRGFANLMRDFVIEPRELSALIEMVVQYNLGLLDRLLELRPDIVYFGDDLGTQDRMPLSEPKFRKFLFPGYARVFSRVRDAGARPYLHSDGHIMEVADDLIEAGVSVLNLQDCVNGVDNIAKRIKGRVCIDLDIDRQRIVPLGTPSTIRDHIRDVVMKLGSAKGGFMMISEINADVPLENVEAVCSAFEEFADYYV